MLAAPLAQAQSCARPGFDGPNLTASGTVNSYWQPPASTTIGPGTTSITLTNKVGAPPDLAPGDLALIIQTQCALLDSTNTYAYGDSVAGDPASGSTDPIAGCRAGQYEYIRAGAGSNAGSLGVGAVNFSTPLVNTYENAAATLTQGQRTFQIIRVPQYSTLTLTNTLTAPLWNGATGGVLVLDVAGALNWGGQAIDVNGAGFRGGAAQNRPVGDAVLTNGYRDTDASGRHASKGEGIAGTPRYVHSDPIATDTLPGVQIDTGIDGYPNGSFGLGAPGNAGGGGSSRNNGARDNGGGGGGGNGNFGGLGAYGWKAAAWNVGYVGDEDFRGFGGAQFVATTGRVVLGGGGGAGDGNNNNGGNVIAGSGAAGGGIVLIRAGSIAGTGTINANGAQAPDMAGNDSAGGGGAGGSVVVLAGSGGGVGTLTVNVIGGRGGDSWITGNTAHGGGGGGAGGVVFASGAAAVNRGGGLNGCTNTGNNPPDSGTCTSSGGIGGLASHGSSAGGMGTQNTAVSLTTDLPSVSAGARCLPQLSVTKSTATALRSPANTTATYSVVINNAANVGAAYGVNAYDNLPNPFQATGGTVTPVYAGGATGPATFIAAANVDPVSLAAPGGTSAATNFIIPGGGSVTLSFTANLNAAPEGVTYQNPANTNFTDPTRNLTQLVSPVTSFDAAAAAGVTSAYQVGGAVGGSNYASASTNNEDVALIGAWKSVKTTTDADGSGITNTTVGDTITWSIWVTNPHATLPLNAFQVTDLIPGNVTFVTGAQTITTVAGACGAVAKNTLFTGAGANTALLNAAQVLPAGCTIRIDLPMVVLAPAVSTNLVNQPTISGTGIAAFLSDNVDATTVGLPAAIAGDATRTGSVAQTQTTARDPTTVFVSPKVVDLVPLKSHVGNFTIGGTGVFTLSARNIAAVASSVGSYTITDTLPPGLSFVSATGTGWACVNAGQVVTCTSATVIPPNSTNPNAITLTVNVLSGAPAQVINRATISGGGEVAAQTINNTVVDYVTVLRPASSVFFPDGAQEALPNSTVWYPHTFLSQDTGSVVFNFTNTAAPATPGWLQTLYVDTNCNGTFDPAEATVLTNPTTPFAVIPGTQICLIVREFVPANALVGYKDQVNITTTLTPSVGPVKTFTRRDITTVALPAALKLVKEVRNVTAGTPFGTSNTGKPGDTLQYRITYTNNGPVPLTLQTVNDATPNFTTHLVAACGSLGTGLATCTLAAQPVAGGIGPVRWTYTGTLNPGGTGNVTMNVQIAP